MKFLFKQCAPISLIVSVLCIGGIRPSLNNIKGTYSILPENQREAFSLIHGAVAWESGVIRRMYDFDQIFPDIQEINGLKKIVGYLKPEKTHAVARLIHALFYRIPGTTTATDFVATKHRADCDLPQTIAKILKNCQSLKILNKSFRTAIQQIASISDSRKEKNLSDILSRLLLPDVPKGSYQQALQYVKKLMKKNDVVKADIAKQLVFLSNFLSEVVEFDKNFRSMIESQRINENTEFEHVILQALRECNSKDLENVLYPEYMVNAIFQAFLYVTCGDTVDARQKFGAYYTALGIDLPDGWEADVFPSVKQPEALAKLEEILAPQGPGAIAQSIVTHYEDFIYDFHQISQFPRPVGYARAKYYYAGDERFVEFSDCMDNAIRNFINLFACNAEENQYSLEKLQSNLGLEQDVHPALAEYLKKFNEVDKAATDEAHSAWLDVISNIPFVSYTMAINSDSGAVRHRYDLSKPFISGLYNPDVFKYMILKKNEVGCDLFASVKNTIILLDHLLNLKLFTGVPGGLAEEFDRTDFVSHYIQILCKKLHLRHTFEFLVDGKVSLEANINYDEVDGTKDCIVTALISDVGGIVCGLVTKYNHGDIILVGAPETQAFIRKKTILTAITDTARPYSLGFILVLLGQMGHLYSNVFSLGLDNASAVHNVISNHLSWFNGANISVNTTIAITSFLLRCADKQPDFMQAFELKKQVFAKYLLPHFPVKNMESCERCLQFSVDLAHESLGSLNAIIRLFAVVVMDYILIVGDQVEGFTEKSIGEIISVAKKSLKDSDEGVRHHSAYLFGELIKRGLVDDDQLVNEVVIELQKNLHSLFQNIRVSSIRVFDILFAQQKGFDQAWEFIKGKEGAQQTKKELLVKLSATSEGKEFILQKQGPAASTIQNAFRGYRALKSLEVPSAAEAAIIQ